MLSTSLQLLRWAEEHSVDVDFFSLPATSALSIQLPDGSCAVALDPNTAETDAQLATDLAHELGHCATGAFYNRYSRFDLIQKHENRADRWAIAHLIPERDMDAAIAAGDTELWQLAERFGVTEDFMKKAVCWYTHGNLAAELYF